MKQCHRNVPWTKVKEILAKVKESRANAKKYGWKVISCDVELTSVETKQTTKRDGTIDTKTDERYTITITYEV